MAEHDGSGFPLSYCLLTMATAVDQHKRRDSLAAWARCVKDVYHVEPTFSHVDKDMAEIGCAKEVWDCKITLCKWHMRRAVKTRLAKAKLATTEYNPESAKKLFNFINIEFAPTNKRTDAEDYEGGEHDDRQAKAASSNGDEMAPEPEIASLRIRLPAHDRPIPPEKSTPQATGFIIRIPALRPDAPLQPGSLEDDEEKESEKRDRRTFCPVEYRDAILVMMEQHYCAHPLIPGHCAPTPAAIHRWAVEKMYRFCEKYDLPEVWAYMWGNWYRPERWVLWARSAHPEIPVLGTTMMLEGQ